MRIVMKKICVIISLLTLMSTTAYSEEQASEQETAPSDFVLKVLDDCKIYAAEDEVDADRLNQYLLNCINDEMVLSDYRLITKLPTL